MKAGRDATKAPPAEKKARSAPAPGSGRFDPARSLHDSIGNRSTSRLLSRKVAVDRPDSPLEREAADIAGRIAGGAAAGAATIGAHAPRLGAFQVPDGHARRPGQGRPLDQASRTFFEPRLGRDLRHVRIHDDAAAATAARDLRARAYTVGSDIVFGAGQYAPGTAAGRTLLAHELVHVAQDRGEDEIHRQPEPDALPTMEMQAYDYILKHGPGSDASDAMRTTFRAMEKFGGSQPRSRWVESINFVVPESGPFGGKVFSPLIEVGRTWVEQTAPDPSAGWNFNVYLSDVGKHPIHRTPAIHVSGTTFRVFMGSVKCPGCHFGQGLQVDLYGGNWVMMTVVPSMTMAAGLANARGSFADMPGPPPQEPPGGWGVRGTVNSGPTTPTTTSLPRSTPSTGGGYSGEAYMGGAAAPKLESVPMTVAPPRTTLSLVPDAAPFAAPGGAQGYGFCPVPMMTPMPFAQSQPFARPIPDAWKDFWPEQSPEWERRRRRRAITLQLPQAKARHAGRYESMVATRSLVHDYGYSRPDPSDPRQADRWREELRPGGRSEMDLTLYRVGVNVLRRVFGMDADRARRTVLVPSWSRQTPHVAMSVDHVVELQLTFPHDRYWANSIMNWALLDLSTNSSVGARLANNIERERTELVADTWDLSYFFIPLVFEAVTIDPYGSEGEHWTLHEIRRGDHVLVLLDWLGIARPPGY